jgi:hypothetical protein
MDIAAHFTEIEHLLLISPVISQFRIIRRRVQDSAGYIRLRAQLTDGGLLELSEYWVEQADGDFARRAYTFHWQNSAGDLIKRWDTAKHFPDLPSAPEHVHGIDGVSATSFEAPTLHLVLKEIEDKLA